MNDNQRMNPLLSLGLVLTAPLMALLYFSFAASALIALPAILLAVAAAAYSYMRTSAELAADLAEPESVEIDPAADATQINEAVFAALQSHLVLLDQEQQIVHSSGAAQRFFNLLSNNQRQKLTQPPAEHRQSQCCDGVNYDMHAHALKSADGSSLGVAIEWIKNPIVEVLDVALESEITDVLNSAREGDLGKRIVTNGHDGSLLELAKAANQLLEVTEHSVVETAAVLGAITDGDLTKKVDTSYQGAFGHLADSTNSMGAKLTEVMAKIQGSTALVKSGSEKISSGNTNLSQRTEEQASSLEETASSMEELTTTVKQNADNAGEANQLAMAAREQAENGGVVVNQAVAAMQEINTSSRKISDIIGVINDIAFQTNLLALNASVEAARAGDQGRGFAVVASEVRNLAGRSATAAKEIKNLIEDSARKVEDGSRLVNESGETLQEIVNGVKKVTDIVGEIAAASHEQAAGIEEVNKAIVQMDQLTQQNASLVEEAASASDSMSGQADELNRLLSFFSAGMQASAPPLAPVQHDTPTMTAAKPSSSDRRATDRPWGGSSSGGGSVAAATKTAVASSSDEEWEEF